MQFHKPMNFRYSSQENGTGVYNPFPNTDEPKHWFLGVCTVFSERNAKKSPRWNTLLIRPTPRNHLSGYSIWQGRSLKTHNSHTMKKPQWIIPIRLNRVTHGKSRNIRGRFTPFCGDNDMPLDEMEAVRLEFRWLNFKTWGPFHKRWLQCIFP